MKKQLYDILINYIDLYYQSKMVQGQLLNRCSGIVYGTERVQSSRKQRNPLTEEYSDFTQSIRIVPFEIIEDLLPEYYEEESMQMEFLSSIVNRRLRRRTMPAVATAAEQVEMELDFVENFGKKLFGNFYNCQKYIEYIER